MKKLKIIMPLLAVLFAVSGVFATEYTQHSVSDVEVTADPSSCTIDGHCDQSNSNTCVFIGIVFRKKGVTICVEIATGIFR